MAVESAADRAAFVDTDEFGIEATYTPQTGAAVTLDGIFDEPFAEVDVDAGVGVLSKTPTFVCRTADLPSTKKQGDAVTIDGTGYVVRELQADGTGMTTVVMDET